MSLLETIDRPADIKPLTAAQLAALAQDVREEILQTISTLGGHLASSLGAVELCLALHYVFDAPDDQLVWDMGYQAFTHKLITGRRARFNTLKQFQGLSGFVNKDESPYDLFTSGHGGTVLSTAMGLAMARDQVKAAPARLSPEPPAPAAAMIGPGGRARQVVAILGDASLGEGMALEALNHIGHVKPNLLVVLNDNKMSIAKPIGGLSRYLNRIITNPAYNRLRKDIGDVLEKLPSGERFVRLAHKIEESIKGFLVPGQFFEELGLRYVGPIDGHNIRELISTLKRLKSWKGPILLHVSTIKGKGYRPAEQDPERFHKIEPFDLATGQVKKAAGNGGRGAKARHLTFTEAFSDELIRIAESNRRVVAITAAMPEGTGVSEFAKRYPERCVDVGMAEQHAVGLAAGLARGGARPIVAIYSTFLQRAYDQIMHEMCLQGLPVILAIDRAGLVGEDGPTHHGVFDIGYLRVLPQLHVLSPKDPEELRAMLRWALEQDGPVALRYARGGIAPPPVVGPEAGSLRDPGRLRRSTTGGGVVCGEPLGRPAKIITGKSEGLRQGDDVALLALGSMVYPALKVADALAREHISATVINARFVKPLDEAMVRQAAQIGRIVTLEEAQIAGGFGSAVSEALDALHLPPVALLRIGLPDAFVEHGTREQLLKLCQLDPDGLTARITAWYHATRAPVDELSLLTKAAE